ncbi:hypothetical protein JVU11DRAFT_8104 [Chiua virens]|nr:hypothetical protein JVU11DRAFT_8104 [Chiua virens]
MLREVNESEEDLRSREYDPCDVGYCTMMVDNSAFNYRDHLIVQLKKQGADNGVEFVEVWRWGSEGYQFLKRGWKRV